MTYRNKLYDLFWSPPILGCVFTFFAAYCRGMAVITAEYLESEGGKSAQISFLGELTNLLFASTYWIASSVFQVYYQQTEIANPTMGDVYTQMMSIWPQSTPPVGLNSIPNSLSYQQSNIEDGSESEEDYATIPDEETEVSWTESELWILLLIRAFTSTLSTLFTFTGTNFISAGDMISVSSTCFTTLSVFGAILLLKEKCSKFVFAGIALCLTGLLVISQPTFIFGGVGDAINWFGLILASGNGTFRTIGSLMVRKVGQRWHWLAVCVTVGAVSVVFLAFYILFCWAVDISFWHDWDTIDGATQAKLWFYVCCVGFFWFAYFWAITKAYQTYDASRLSIIYISEVPLTYLMQLLLLGLIEDWLVYSGSALIVFGGLVIGYESIRRSDVNFDASQSAIDTDIDDIEADQHSGLAVNGDEDISAATPLLSN